MLGLGIGLRLRLGMGLEIGLGSGFEYFRQYNVIRRIGIRRNGAEPCDVNNVVPVHQSQCDLSFSPVQLVLKHQQL